MDSPTNPTKMAGCSSTVDKSWPDPLIILPKAVHTYTIILLHGLGSNGEKFGQEFVDTAVSSIGCKITDLIPGLKFVFPTAKKHRSAVFKRVLINQWFNISSLDEPSKRQEIQMDGLAESSNYIMSILEREMELIPPRNIILGGLSQGCAIALFMLLGLSFPLGGFVGMSGWLPFCKDIEETVTGNDGHSDDGIGFSFGDEGDDLEELASVRATNFVRDVLSIDEIAREMANARPSYLTTPVFLGHGEKDEKIRCALGEQAASTLRMLGMDVTWRSYKDQGHWYKVPDEIEDILDFLNSKAMVEHYGVNNQLGGH